MAKGDDWMIYLFVVIFFLAIAALLTPSVSELRKLFGDMAPLVWGILFSSVLALLIKLLEVVKR